MERTVVEHMGIALLVALVLAEVAVIATSVYLHRGLAHRALRLHPVTDGFRTLLWLTTGQSRRVHRKHHAFTDRVGDPHSPRLFGFWHIQLWNVYYHAREAVGLAAGLVHTRLYVFELSRLGAPMTEQIVIMG